jgi:hypothetical protein
MQDGLAVPHVPPSSLALERISPRLSDEDRPISSPRISLSKGSGSMYNLFRLAPRERAFTTSVVMHHVNASFELDVGTLKIRVYKCPEAEDPLAVSSPGFENSTTHVTRVRVHLLSCHPC